MPNEVRPSFDEESPPPRASGDDARQFFDTPASTAGGLHDAARRISNMFSSTPATREEREQQQQRRQQQQQQFQPTSILKTPKNRNRFPLPGDTPGLTSYERSSSSSTPASSSNEDTSSNTAGTSNQSRFVAASPQKAKFVRDTDNDLQAVNLRVALRKEDYGVLGSSNYRKNMEAATYGLTQKFGVARHKLTSTADQGDETKSRFVQQVLVGLSHRVKEGHVRAQKYDFMDICTLADFLGCDSSDCATWWGTKEINIWTDWELITESHARAWQLSINRRFSDGDLTASLWLREFLYNSCTDSLRTAIDKRYTKIPADQQGGITYLWYCLDEMFTMSREVRQAMLEFIALFKRRGVARYTGENILVIEEELSCVAKRLAADGSLTHDHVIDVLTGLCICSHAKFKQIFAHLLSNADLGTLDLMLPTIPLNATPLETLEAVLQKACDLYDQLCISGQWIKIKDRNSALNSIINKRKCWNCGEEDHGVSDCPKPRDETTINRNREEFMKNRQSSGNSGRGGRGGNSGRGGNAGRGGRGGRGSGSGASDYQRKAWEAQGIKVDSDGILKVNCKFGCGLNTTHSSKYHEEFMANPSGFRLPYNNAYVKACQLLSGQTPQTPKAPPNVPTAPPPAQPSGQDSSGRSGALMLDRAQLESKMSAYERNSTDPNAASIVDAFRSFLSLN